jgi:hypothetical protein
MDVPRGAGGTPGGLGAFFLGAGLSGLGLYLLFSRVVVSAGIWHGWFGSRLGPGTSIGAVVLLFMVGVGALFFDGKSRMGWVLLPVSLAVLALEVVTSLQIHFLPTSLPLLLLIVGVLAAGLGLLVRSLRPS